MLRRIFLCSAVLLTLSGCARIADSRLKPFNWFGQSQDAPVTETGEIRPLVPAGRTVNIVDARPMLQSVTALSVDRSPTGAIVRATGVAPTQGFFNAELVNAGISGAVLTLEFRAQAPLGFEAEGSAASRQINTAFAIDAEDLSTIRRVRVQAATNARTAAR
jgi:hypothetical protein